MDDRNCCREAADHQIDQTIHIQRSFCTPSKSWERSNGRKLRHFYHFRFREIFETKVVSGRHDVDTVQKIDDGLNKED
jgi:hypothetical protein